MPADQSDLTQVIPIPPTAPRLGRAIGIAAVLSILTITVFYSGIGFFGPINDLVTAAGAVLGAVLAWHFFLAFRSYTPIAAFVSLLFGWAGAAAIAINSLLVAAGSLDWRTGGMYTAIGLGLQGFWLIGLIRFSAGHRAFSPGQTRMGWIAGISMLTGFGAGPLLAYGSAWYGHPLAWLLFASAGAGWLLFPLWCWRLGSG